MPTYLAEYKIVVDDSRAFMDHTPSPIFYQFRRFNAQDNPAAEEIAEEEREKILTGLPKKVDYDDKVTEEGLNGTIFRPFDNKKGIEHLIPKRYIVYDTICGVELANLSELKPVK